MDSSKTFRFNLFCNGNLEMLTCHAVITSISKLRAAPVYDSDVTLNNQQIDIQIDISGGDYFYAVFTILTYNHNGSEHDISPNNGDPSNKRNVSFLGVFSINDNTIALNPLTTVASAYCFAMGASWATGENISITGGKDFCQVAYAMKGNFISTAGPISKVIASAPNDKQTNSYAAFCFLGNLLNYTITDQNIYNTFLGYETDASGQTVSSTVDAIVSLAQNPFDHVTDIYNLVANQPLIYYPSLQQLVLPEGVSNIPNQWTLAIKINDSGSENFLIAGTAYTVFDKDNKAWVTNNFRAGTPNSGGHCMVFNPDGSPGGISPILGGGILGPGFGIAVNPTGDTIAIGNYGWGSKDYNPVAGSISVFSSDGSVMSPPGGNVKGLCRVQGMCYDPDGNLWMASWGTQAPMEDPDGPHVYDTPSQPSAVVCYVGGDPDQALVYNEFEGGKSEWHGTFDVVIDQDGNCLVSNAGTAKKMASSVYKVRLSANKDAIEYVAHWAGDWQNGNPVGFEELRQVQVDGDGYIYAGGITSCRVVKLQAVKKDGVEKLEKVAEYFDNVYGPWGITIDAKGKKFLTGFGGRKQAEIVNGKIHPEREFAITVVEADDQDWSHTKLMTLPTGGEEVRLANGQPLYGNQTLPEYLPNGGSKVPNDYKALIESLKGVKMPPSYSPLMRTTATSVDRAGNLWCANNWKPSLFSDVWANTPNANPGGDGVVIFVGVAEPLAGIND